MVMATVTVIENDGNECTYTVSGPNKKLLIEQVDGYCKDVNATLVSIQF